MTPKIELATWLEVGGQLVAAGLSTYLGYRLGVGRERSNQRDALARTATAFCVRSRRALRQLDERGRAWIEADRLGEGRAHLYFSMHPEILAERELRDLVLRSENTEGFPSPVLDQLRALAVLLESLAVKHKDVREQSQVGREWVGERSSYGSLLAETRKSVAAATRSVGAFAEEDTRKAIDAYFASEQLNGNA